ncbi:MAG TPA: serine hydrolase domain-containing protein [Gemmatimonadales bacterium]|nr:serine hydrolase domain-containing protein [Gemmatimonadales bacterium]
MIRRSLRLLPVLLALLAVPSRAAAQGPDGRAPSWADFVRRMDGYMKEQAIVGGSAMLVRDGRIVERHHAGFADGAGRRPVTDRTLFHWASVTKTLTAVALLQLRDRGLLALDDPVTRWVPELRRVHDSAGDIDRITLRMLLGHSSGLQSPTWPWTEGEAWEPFEPTEWEQLVAMMPYQRLRFRPGTAYGYSNPGYIYLAKVIERVTGDPWAVYVQKNIWMPLGFDRSYVGRTPWHMAADRGHGYRADSLGGPPADLGADFDPGITIPNSGWNAPVEELARWAAWLAGTGDGVLARRTLEEIRRPVRSTGNRLPEFSDVGLGVFSLDADGRRIIGHTGDQAGYRALLYVDPDRHTGLVLVFNTTREGAAADSALGALARDGLRLLR